MGRPSGTQDPRTFRHLAKIAPDGSVAAIVEVADSVANYDDEASSLFVDVTDLFPYDLRTVKVTVPQLTVKPVAPVQANPAQDTPEDRAALAAYQSALKVYRDQRAVAEQAVKTVFSQLKALGRRG